jgi:beta-lactamase superfamily II metal-dependent hydrolase
MKRGAAGSIVLVLLALWAVATRAADTLDIYFIDTEGGQATLLVTPAGGSMLIDAGFAGLDSNNPDQETGRDATRIAAAAKLANVQRLDVFMPTHFHGDHVGGVEQLAARLPIATFVDDGPAVQESAPLRQKVGAYSEIYAAEFAKGRHLVVKAGDKIPIRGIEVSVVAANGKTIAAAGEPNAHCAGLAPRPAGNPEDTESIGIVVQFGRFRFANFGDMPWNKELELLCPGNRVGRIDVYEAPGHGREPSPAVQALAPRAVIAPNGARKGAGAATLKGFRAIPGVEDLWLLHFNVPGGNDANPPAEFIANLDEPGAAGGSDAGRYLKLSAMEDGSFTMFNSRTKATREYAARK